MKKLIVLIILTATIFNIIAGAFFFLDIQTMEFPETTITLELIDLNANEATIQTTLWINNQNSFSIFLQNLTIITMTETGHIINRLFIEGGEAHPHENTSFTSTAQIQFNETIPNQLTSKITGTVGFLFLGILKKTLPLKFMMITSLNNIINQFALPQIHLTADFTEITQDAVNFTASMEITNPYSIDMEIQNILVTIQTDTGSHVGTLTIQGSAIPAQTTKQLSGAGQLLLKALNANTLSMNTEGNVTVIIAGMKKTMNLSISAEIAPPDLTQLLSNQPTDASLTGKYKFTLKGLQDHIIFEIKNPNKLTLLATDITVQIYRIDRDAQRLICNGTLPDGVITAQNTTILEGDMLIPYLHLLPHLGERLFADQLQVTIRTNITIPGVNQTIWVGMTGYQDFPIHRP
jgi:hypothetical protein